MQEKYLKELNAMQTEAVLYTEGPLLLVAGAGAGKTKTITYRIAHLVEKGVNPSNILAVTFTNKAAREMRERTLKILSGKNYDSVPFISTFHALGVHIIKENAHLVGLTKYFTIIDESDAISMIKEFLKEMSLDPKEYEPRKIKSIISRAKGDFIDIESFTRDAMSGFQSITARIWERYEGQLKKEQSLDFDDLLLKAVKVLREHIDIREKYHKRWQYIHIDEYQDTNEVQYVLAKLLVGENQNICIVGDTDQCLIGGTKIKMADGKTKNIELLKKNDLILSNYGSGDLRGAKIINKKILVYKGDIVEIKTQKGTILQSTPEHTHFAGYRLGLTPQIFLNYLMYKKDFGWRIGTTSIYTKGQRKPTVGFIQRSNQEHSDLLWVIATYKNENDARVGEYIFSLKYQIPTIPFVPRKGISKNGYVHDIIHLKRIFSSLDTEKSAKNLLQDLGLSFDYPHHIPQSNNSNRRNVNVTLCADRRGKNPMHLISIHGNDEIGKNKLKSLGLSVRADYRNTKNWRFETVFADYGKAYMLALKIGSLFENVNFVFTARLGGEKTNTKDHNSLRCLPASSIMPGMVLFTENGYDVVLEKNRIKSKKIKMYDLDIERTHNFIANGIITHNCIYSWRGANIKNMLHFEKDYPNTKIVMLEQNYRSTKTILEAANEIIKKNVFRVPKNLFTENVLGDAITIFEAYDEGNEARYIARKTYELLEKNLAEPKEIAVLYRANFQSRVLEEAFIDRQIPYQVLGTKFFDRKEVRDVLSYIRASMNPESLSEIKRIINFPARGIGKTTLLKIFAGQKESLPFKMQEKIKNFYDLLKRIDDYRKTHSVSETLIFTIKESGIENQLQNGTAEEQERLENIKELVSVAIKYDQWGGEGIELLLTDASLASDQDSLNKDNGGVRLMTVHASKGLEFKYVFIAGLEQDLFPHQRLNAKGGDQEEERRLFYVALTRAKHKLFLSYASIRTIFGMKQVTVPSEFLSDIPEHLLELEKDNGENGDKIVYI